MKVSVIVLTYNSYKTVSKALDSIAMQKTNFEFEVVVADDGSTDMTRQSVKQYVVKFVRNEHIGIMKNFASALAETTGEYIAFCDGDDYWIDPYKLQKQVDYMDAHPECGLCYTNVIRKGENEVNLPITKPASYDSMLRGCTVSAVSVMIRSSKGLFDNTTKAIRRNIICPDYFTWLYYFANFHTHLITDLTCVYQVRDGSLSHTKDRGHRLAYIVSIMKTKMYFVIKYGCSPSTFVYLWYRLGRDTLSIILKRWYK